MFEAGACACAGSESFLVNDYFFLITGFGLNDDSRFSQCTCCRTSSKDPNPENMRSGNSLAAGEQDPSAFGRMARQVSSAGPAKGTCWSWCMGCSSSLPVDTFFRDAVT